jgi:hypothetical protein
MLPSTPHRFYLGSLTPVAFAASGYAFLSVRDSFIPLSRRTRRLALAATVAATAVGVVAAGQPPTSVLSLVGSVVLVSVWAACVGEPIFRFWVASRGLPMVQRNQLRGMSLAMAASSLSCSWSRLKPSSPASLHERRGPGQRLLDRAAACGGR